VSPLRGFVPYENLFPTASAVDYVLPSLAGLPQTMIYRLFELVYILKEVIACHETHSEYYFIRTLFALRSIFSR
jgi:hypothetical protein